MRRTQNSIVPSQLIAHLRLHPEREKRMCEGEGEREGKKKERKESRDLFYSGRAGSRHFFFMFVSYPRRRACWTSRSRQVPFSWEASCFSSPFFHFILQVTSKTTLERQQRAFFIIFLSLDTGQGWRVAGGRVLG